MLDMWSEFHQFVQVTVEPVPSMDRLVGPEVRHLFEWWSSFGPDAIPRRRDFDIADHAAIASNGFLVRMVGRGHFQFRVQGEAVVRLIGRSNAGLDVRLDSDEPHLAELARYYQSIAMQRTCKRCWGTLAMLNKSHRHFESIDCALDREPGEVGFIIGAMAAMPSQLRRVR